MRYVETHSTLMARIDAILKLVKDQGASDLHMSSGSPPMVRINGEIMPIP